MIKYPTQKKVYQSKPISTKNRGMGFETLIDQTNSYYLDKQIAVIHKKPTPVQIVKVDYPARQKARIKEAYYKTPSTTDYNGIYKGYYIDFDVKETRSKTAFPIKNIHPHQIEHLKAVHEQKGLAFILIAFKAHQTYHLLPFDKLYVYVKRSLKGRKSITYEEIIEDSYAIKESYLPAIDYLKAVDLWLNEK